MRPHSAEQTERTQRTQREQTEQTERTQRSRPAKAGPTSAAAFLDQLSAASYILDLRPPAATGPVVAGPVGRATREHPPCPESVPGVLLLSRSRDGEFDAVANLLGRVGVPATRINADELANADLLADFERRTVRVHGRRLRPTVCWLRHFSPAAIDGDAGNTTNAGNTANAGDAGDAHDTFLRESWSSAADQLVDIAATGIRAHRPGLLAQVRLAERLGIEVPRTVLTTDPCQAKELLGGARLIIKAAHRHFVEVAPGSLTGVFPAIVPSSGLVPLPRPGPPAIVQEYIDHSAEVRVYYVAGEVYGFQIVKTEPADLWMCGDRVRVHLTDLTPEVIRAARKLAAALSMRYCAFDFLIRDGVPIFLEMNPDGDWRWLESKAGTTVITMAVTRMLCDLHRAHRSTAMGGSPPPAESFDLLTFLIR